MNKTKLIILTCFATLGLAACGKSEPSASTTQPDVTPTAAPASTMTEKKPATSAVAKVEAPANYRVVTAKLRGSGEPIEVMVPDDIDVTSGQLLEYHLADDGVYYYKSVIPQ